MVYKHAYLNTLLLLHTSFMLSVVKMPLKGEVGGHAFYSHGNYIVDHGKSGKNHGIVFLNFCGNPAKCCSSRSNLLLVKLSDQGPHYNCSFWLKIYANFNAAVNTVNLEIFASVLFSQNFANAKFRENKSLAK